jgi:glutaredoxin
MERVEGSDHGSVRLFTLSTCVWCKKTKQLLKEIDVGYEYVDVDLLEGEERERTMQALRAVNPRCSFPSLVVNDQCIVGYQEARIREVLQRP